MMRDSITRIIFAIIYSLVIIIFYTIIFLCYFISDFLFPLGISLIITGGIMTFIWYLLPPTSKYKLGIKLFFPYAPDEINKQKMWYSISGIVGFIGLIIVGISFYL